MVYQDQLRSISKRVCQRCGNSRKMHPNDGPCIAKVWGRGSGLCGCDGFVAYKEPVVA